MASSALPPTFTANNIEHQVESLRWSGLEQALRDLIVAEGGEPVWIENERKAREEDAAHEAREAERQKRPDARFVPNGDLETAERFSRTFTEAALGIALNEGGKGRIVVKRILPGSAAASRRIPQGGVASVVAVGGSSTEGLSLKQVQKLIKEAERPVTIDFEQPASTAPPDPDAPKGKWNPARQRFEAEGEAAEQTTYRAGIDF